MKVDSPYVPADHGGRRRADPGAFGAARAASRPATIRAVMQGDLRSLDPIWTTANITAYHGA